MEISEKSRLRTAHAAPFWRDVERHRRLSVILSPRRRFIGRSVQGIAGDKVGRSGTRGRAAHPACRERRGVEGKIWMWLDELISRIGSLDEEAMRAAADQAAVPFQAAG